MTEEIDPLEIAACCSAQLRHALCEGEQTVAASFSGHTCGPAFGMPLRSAVFSG